MAGLWGHDGEDRAWLRWADLNRRPAGYEPAELPDCSTARRAKHAHAVGRMSIGRVRCDSPCGSRAVQAVGCRVSQLDFRLAPCLPAPHELGPFAVEAIDVHVPDGAARGRVRPLFERRRAWDGFTDRSLPAVQLWRLRRDSHQLRVRAGGRRRRQKRGGQQGEQVSVCVRLH